MLLSSLPESISTPCYFYDLSLLERTLDSLLEEAGKYGYMVHYAIKANANPVLLQRISRKGLGADCVSGNEIRRALECGFPSRKIVLAGVGKNDWEIELALQDDIFCFNCESLPEIRVIHEIAARTGKKARIALRINPDVKADTHHYITTGTEENKFGIYLYDLENTILAVKSMPNIELIGLHFHIGSQITDMDTFRKLSIRVNEIQEKIKAHGLVLPHINFGGGLGIDYEHPYSQPIVDFNAYFSTFNRFFKPSYPGQQVHFELGRSVVAHCGDLISKVLYVKEGKNRKFVILDAGMNDLLRPALYQAYHKIENISSTGPEEKYDVVGPICESADCFGKDVPLNATRRGDLIIIHSCGAYGETMSSGYNLRDPAHAIYKKD